MKRHIICALTLFPFNSALATDLGKVVAIRNVLLLDDFDYDLSQGSYLRELAMASAMAQGL